MVNSAKSSKLYRSLFRNEHERLSDLPGSTKSPPHSSLENPYQNLSDTTVPLAALKTTETELQQRWQHKLENFFPLWFHAHTERNIYLWRHGLSIGDEALFDFWVDVAALIKKREKKLLLDADNSSGSSDASALQENPLTNPQWSSETSEVDTNTLIEEELRYLNDLHGTFNKIASHIHALSVATCMINPSGAELVILPFKRPARTE